MKRGRGGLAVGLLLIAGPAAAQELTPVVPVDSVTVSEAVERALEANPQMVQARTSLGTAEYGVRQAYASLLPSLSLSSGTSLSSAQRYDPTLGTTLNTQSRSYSAGLSGGVELFAGGRNLASVRSAQATEDAASATIITRRFAVALSAKQAFFAVLRSGELIALSQRRTGQAEENLAAAERRLSAGRATRSDVLRARLELSNARQATLEAQAQQRTTMYALGRTVGVRGPVAAVAPASLDPAPLALSPSALRALVADRAPTVESAQAEVSVAAAGLAQSRAQYFPTVSLSGGYNWSNDQFGLDQGRTSWSTRLNFSYPLFNGLQRSAQVDRANAQLTVAEAQAADVVRTAVSELEALLAALELAELQIAILEESVEVAREDFRVQQERYGLGAATILELVSSQIALLQAENDLINARYDYQITRAELESLVGQEL
ncbi:MAG: TolC family protein [Longimicrobiales bacterium]|nr:TolC family protein [Longimicrobiales bacterium]